MNGSVWDRIEDPRDLAKAKEVLVDLQSLLASERAAVVKMDAVAVSMIADMKGAVLERLRTVLTSAKGVAAGSRAISREERHTLRQFGEQVFSQVEANAALLADAIDVISAKLGLSRDVGTYDARARVLQDSRPFAGQHA